MTKFKSLRKANKLTLFEMGQHLKVNPATYSQWENGKREPDIAMLIKIADFFNVTLDFLLGREYDETEVVEALYRNEDFYINKDRIMPLLNKISKFDNPSFNLLEGYIEALSDKLKNKI